MKHGSGRKGLLGGRVLCRSFSADRFTSLPMIGVAEHPVHGCINFGVMSEFID